MVPGPDVPGPRDRAAAYLKHAAAAELIRRRPAPGYALKRAGVGEHGRGVVHVNYAGSGRGRLRHLVGDQRPVR